MFADGFVVRDAEIMELSRIVVAGQAGQLLKVFGFEINDGGGGVAMRLLTAGNERLAKEAADGFAAVEPQVAGPRGEAEDFFRMRSTEPLEIDWQLRGIEIFARG